MSNLTNVSDQENRVCYILTDVTKYMTFRDRNAAITVANES